MNKKTCLSILLFTCGICNAQNLVPNSGFENISNCPSVSGQLSLAIPWRMPFYTNGASSDLFNACNGWSQGVPINVVGYQTANSGLGYSGIFTYGYDSREYIQVHLISPLIAGVIYRGEMYVSPSENAGIAIDAIGMYISSGPVSGNGSSNPISVIPQISNSVNNIISDTLGWTLVSGFYTASGGENFITIGNFLNDSNTNFVIFNNTGWGRGYYLVDDVSISIATQVNESDDDRKFIIYPNPFSSKLNIKINNNQLSEIIIYDISDRMLLQQQFTNSFELNTDQLAKGMYIYEARDKNGVVKQGKLVKD